jgi:membrane fusion protein (multidrug efflux system)
MPSFFSRAVGGLAAAVSLSLLLLTGCGSDSTAQGPAGGGMPPPEVVAVTVTRGNLPLSMEYMGQTAGSREVEVRARVGGILLRRTYAEGTPVRQGDLLFEIDPAPFQATRDQAQGRLSQAEAKLAQAKRDLARMEQLFKGDVISQKDRDDALTAFESATAEVTAARAAVKEADLNLGYTKVEAPISGLTSKEARSEGSLVAAASDSSLLTTISRVDPIYVNFSVPGPETMVLRQMRETGQIGFNNGADFQVSLIMPDGGVFGHEGRINFTDTQVDQTTGVVKFRAEFPNPENKIMPGQFTRVRLNGAYLKDAMTVPQGAVLTTQQGTIVWVVDAGDVIAPRPVVLGRTEGNSYLVEKGLSPGDRVVSEGVIKVRPGMTVTVRGETPDPTAPGAPGAAQKAPEKAQGEAQAATAPKAEAAQ